jgi:hypothetical protein
MGTGFLTLSLALATVGSPFPAGRPAADAARPREVVILYSDRVFAVADGVLTERLQSAPGGARLFTENVDLGRLDDEEYRTRLVDVLRRKYRDRYVDLVIPVGLPAVRFMADRGDAAFPGVPVVFSTVDAERLRAVKLPPFIAGVSGRIAALPTVRAALDLQAGTRRVVVITGESPSDVYWRERVREELRVLPSGVEVQAPGGFTMPELLDHLRRLPDHTIVLFVTMTEDATGSTYSTDAFNAVSAASRVPVFAVYEQALGFGVVGGFMFSYEREAERAAGIALRVLAGTPPEAIGVHEEASRFVFDWRQLRRWNLPEDRLPPGSVVRYRPLSAWDLYRLPILAGVIVIALLAALVVGLLVQSRRRHRAERDLDERLRFETLLSDITRKLTQADVSALDVEIDSGLRRLAEALAVDRAELAELNEGSGDLDLTNSYLAGPHVPPLPPVMEAARFPWMMARLWAGQPLVRLSRLAELPPEAATDRAAMEAMGTRQGAPRAYHRRGAARSAGPGHAERA